MKKITLLAVVFAGSFSFAQSQSISLKKDQQLVVTTVATSDMDLGMGMQINNNTNSVHTLLVQDDTNDKQYKIGSTLTKMKIKSEMMGKQIDYDSDKKEDRDSEFGKTVSQALDKTQVVLVNKHTGVAIVESSPEKKDIPQNEDPFTGMMGSMAEADDASIASQVFFMIPVGKKPGMQWADSTVKDGMKKLDFYTLESISGDIATVSTKGSLSGTSNMEAQGNSFEMTMNTTNTGSILLDIKTNIIKKRIVNADLTGSIEMMGQSLSFSGKTSSTTSVE